MSTTLMEELNELRAIHDEVHKQRLLSSQPSTSLSASVVAVQHFFSFDLEQVQQQVGTLFSF